MDRDVCKDLYIKGQTVKYGQICGLQRSASSRMSSSEYPLKFGCGRRSVRRAVYLNGLNAASAGQCPKLNSSPTMRSPRSHAASKEISHWSDRAENNGLEAPLVWWYKANSFSPFRASHTILHRLTKVESRLHTTASNCDNKISSFSTSMHCSTASTGELRATTLPSARDSAGVAAWWRR